MIKEGVLLGGRYEIASRIGVGGMADVYKAIDTVLNRYVAVKVLKREFREDEGFVNKFRSEAQAAAGLTHPNIVNVYDVAEDRGLYYIVMELVEGITLKDYIQKKGQLTPKEVVGIAVQVCSAMDMAHSHNIIHRDIKPQNIMISKEGKVKVTDFGIAKATSSNTISVNAMGSVHYTSPEQARGGFSDAKSDIYSLGITMYEMITGRLPFDGESTVSIALKHLQEDMVLPSEYVPDIPYSLENIIVKCTQKSPDRRYADVGALIRDLKRSLAEPDGDFVKIAPFVSVADTVMISAEELEEIQEKSYYNSKYNEEDYDEDYDDEEREERRVRKRNGTSKKSEIDPKMAKIMKILTVVVIVIFVGILIFAIGSAAGLIQFGPGVSEKTEETGKIPVPSLIGKTEDEAKEELDKLGLQMKVVSKEESKEYEAGIIFHQRTQEGAKVHEGAIIQVEVSSGKLLEVPELSKKDYIDARDKLIEIGFDKDNIKMEEEPHDEIEEDKVTRTEPIAGEWLTKDTEITIYVSTGIEMLEVPKLVGMTKEEAEKTLTDMGFVGSATEAFSVEEAGKVVSQSVDEGDELAKGSTIEYVVSKGEEPKEQVTVPTDLTGKSYYDVKATLDNMGLIVKKVSQSSYEYYEDEVIAVPLSGEAVDVGSTVEVYVSVGPGPSGDTTTDGTTSGTTVTQ